MVVKLGGILSVWSVYSVVNTNFQFRRERAKMFDHGKHGIHGMGTMQPA